MTKHFCDRCGEEVKQDAGQSRFGTSRYAFQMGTFRLDVSCRKVDAQEGKVEKADNAPTPVVSWNDTELCDRCIAVIVYGRALTQEGHASGNAGKV